MSYPIDTIRRRMMMTSGGGVKYKGSIDCAMQILKNEAFMSCCYLFSSNIFAMINYVGFATWLPIGLAVFCLPYLRWKHPEWERPIKVNLIFPIIYVLCSIFVTLVPMIASPVETGIGCAIIFTGVPVYFIVVSDDYVKKPESVRRLLGSVTAAAQKVLLVLPKDD